MNKVERYHNDLTVEQVKALLHYDPETGRFIWISGRADRVGREAASVAASNYRTIHIGGRNYRRGRLAWLYMTGSWPDREIDHVNGVPHDDRWANLRLATRRQQEWNKAGVANRSGFKGVTFVRRNTVKKWRAMIRVDGRRLFLGCFEKPEAAAAAYDRAALRYFGEFARVNRGDYTGGGGGS